MASMGAGHLDPEPLIRKVKGPGMLNKYLTAICKAEGLPSGGVKAELQSRIIENIRSYAASGDITKYEKLRAMLDNPGSVSSQHPGARFGPYTSSSPASSSPRASGNNFSNGYGPGAVNGFRSDLHFDFKPTPFYTIQRQIGETKTCDTMAQHRHTVSISIKAMNDATLQNVQFDKSLRIMVFCVAEGGSGKQDIAFPHQSEIKVNGGEVRANLRGLKNKPGSTRPVDITDLLRLKPPTYPNNVEMTYALTTKKFYLMVYTVKTTPVTDLVKTLEYGKRLTKESVVNEMLTKARDPDIVTTSTVMSLKCPLSTLRMELPCRSLSCRHNQCFDATSFLQLQEQGPTWSCPICNNPAPFESLVVDDYVRNILSNTPRSVDQVTIEPDGKWSQNTKPDSPSNANGGSFPSDDDDDLIEIKDTRVTSLRNDSTPFSSIKTPPMSSSREASTSSLPAARPQSNKRPVSQVIDLTLSDDEDEDDEPISRAPKRQQFSGGYYTPHTMFSSYNG